MENDQQDGNQGQGRLQTENLDATGELPANNNGHETAESRQEIAAESSGKRTVSSRKIEANRQIARALAEHSDDLQQSREADPEPDSVASSNPEMDVMTDHLFLTSEGLENQMRFEAMINRMLNHAIAELERIQTRRKEAAPVADR